jgi:hypothetical protein
MRGDLMPPIPKLPNLTRILGLRFAQVFGFSSGIQCQAIFGRWAAAQAQNGISVGRRRLRRIWT